MTERPDGSRSEGRRPLRPDQLGLGFLAFLGVNLWVLLAGGLEAASLVVGAVYAAVVVVGAAFLYFLLDLRGFAIGFVTGFVLLTVVSGGTCTLFSGLLY